MQPLEPKIGATFRLRGGHVVTIKKLVRYNGSDTIAFYVGDYVPPASVRYSCQVDGHYAPECGERPHGLDIVELIQGPPEAPGSVAAQLEGDGEHENA